MPNESANVKEAMYKKSIGLRKGVSDLILLLPNKVYFVEVKTDVGRQSEEQKKFEEIVNNLGFDYVLVRSLENFITFVNSILKV